MRYFDYSNLAGFDSARKLPLGSLVGDGSVVLGGGLFAGDLYTVYVSQ